MRLVIGVDSSTTGCKAIAWDAGGRARGEGRARYEMLRPRPSWYEQDTDAWWKGAVEALRGLAGRIDARRVEALCITHQRESFVPVDADGRPLRNAILWLDERSRAQVELLERRFGAEALHQLTGKPPAMIPALPKILWLLENEPAVAAKAAMYLDAHAFLVARLCGTARTSLPSADPLGLVDLRHGRWAEDLIRDIGLRLEQLPEITAAGGIVGRVSASAAKATGLREGLPVVAGGGDGQCAGLGAGAVDGARAYLNMGTAVVSGTLSREYATDRAFRTLASPIPGAFVFETCLKGGVFTVGWFIERFAPDLAGTADPELALEAEAAAVPPGCRGLVLVPYWHNVLNPYWDPAASGITVGWTGAHGRGHFYRAILEGIAFEQRLATEGVATAVGRKIEELVILGGGSRSDLWCGIVADVTGIPVVRAGDAEATCLGAGILAAVAAGWHADPIRAAGAMTRTAERFDPDPERRGRYDRLYREVYKPLFPALQPVLRKLADLTEE